MASAFPKASENLNPPSEMVTTTVSFRSAAPSPGTTMEAVTVAPTVVTTVETEPPPVPAVVTIQSVSVSVKWTDSANRLVASVAEYRRKRVMNLVARGKGPDSVLKNGAEDAASSFFIADTVLIGFSDAGVELQTEKQGCR